MLSLRERILKVAWGEMVDKIPYAPRIELWHNANVLTGSLPDKYKDFTADEISRAEGWALHKGTPEFLKINDFEDTVHRGIGLHHLKEFVYKFTLPSDVEVRVQRDTESTYVEYHTPVGDVSTTVVFTEEMKKSGASITWVKEHPVKRPEDYRVMAYIYGNLKLEPDYDKFIEWKNGIGEDGIAIAQSIGLSCGSPMHFIQKILIGATEFYYHYNDYQKEMREAEEALVHVYNQLLKIIADSPAEMVAWGANFDDMITYPSYYEKDIMPWVQKAGEVFREKGILLQIHPDGENQKLMDLIADSGADVADAVTPYPMTKLTIDEYYDRWCRSEKLTIWGGIPESLLLEESTSDEEFEAYLDNFFKAIAPGKRFIVGIGDSTPPAAKFERLIRIGERIEKEGRLPIEGGAARPLSDSMVQEAASRVTPKASADERFETVQQDVLKGDEKRIVEDVKEMLDEGFKPHDILNEGMLSAMEVIGERFKDGSVFIPEVLLSARAMNEALQVLEPHLASDGKKGKGTIMIGTVHGDLHDIGKNMVITMLKGVGFDCLDIGINVSTDEFVKQVSEHKPDILGMSALLTTTLPEMQKVIRALEEAGLRGKVKIMVGGAPVNEKYALSIGADGYAHDAGEAVVLAKKLMQELNAGRPEPFGQIQALS